jgi:cyanophycinase
MNNNKFPLILILLLTLACQQTQPPPTPTKGPENGKILLLGGGILEIHANLIKKFAGGDSAKILVIPTALSDEELAKDPEHKKIKRRFSRVGIENIAILHTRDKTTANDPSFYQRIDSVMGIFILGGNTQRILESYLNTKTQIAMESLLNRGGIIAGVSAGSGAQAAFFSEGKMVKGFEFLEGVIVMNHFLSRNKPFDHVAEIQQNRDRISLGIDDNTGILVQGERFEVVGRSYVAVYDGTQYHRSNDSISPLLQNSERFYLLQNGDRYNLSQRMVESNQRLTPISLSNDELKEYAGHFQSTTNKFFIDYFVENDTLKVKNSFGWNPYPILPFEKDIFYATNRNMWFRFIRETQTGKVVKAQKMRSILQENIIVEMKKSIP